MKRLLLASSLAVFFSAGLSSAQSVPTPESVIGWAPCADYKLATYEQIADYFRKLDAASGRMELVETGKTAEGRTQLMAIISSEQNLKNLARYKEISQKLALARGLNDETARALAREGKAVIWIDFGLHSTEVAHGQTAPWMAYRAVTEETAEMKFIRDNVIFLLVPNMNPDGTTLVANWYMKNLGTPFEQTAPPELYHKYVGHDDNRDWFMFNMPETQNSGKQMYHEWFPQVLYNQHQTAPFPARIFVPPFEDPMNPNIPALVIRGVNTVGDAMTRRLDQEGKAGAVSRLQFDTWWNGGARTAPYFHNMVGILTETGHASATPATYDPAKFPKAFANGEPTLEPTTYYPNPYRGGEWHLRNSCEYMMTGSIAVLDIGAKRREEWLYDIYQMGRDAIRAGANETYVVPADDQWDLGTVAKMVNVLRWGAVEVERAKASFTAGGKTHPAGSFIIRGAQPFRAHLSDMLNPQVYPDRRLYPGGPPERPYDITGWTLSMQMGVKVVKVAETVTADTEKVTWASVPAGSMSPVTTVAYALDPRANDSFIAVNRLLKAGDAVYRSTASVDVSGASWPPGTFLVAPGAGTHARIEQASRDLGLTVGALSAIPSGEVLKVKTPRVALYHAWGGNMDEGWTRWILEKFEFPYTSVYDKDIRAGNLRAKFDVLVLPDAPYENMIAGLAPGSMPPEYTGGMTPRGVSHVYDFVASGGTLVAMDSAVELPIEAFGLPIRNITANQQESQFFIPGTLLRMKVDPKHAVAYGMPAEVDAFFIHSPAFSVGYPRSRFEEQAGESGRSPEGVTTIASYPDKDLLRSGWLMGERIIQNRAAVVEAAVEKGRAVLLGFRVQHRGQPHATFKLLFNSLYLGASERGPMPRTATEQN